MKYERIRLYRGDDKTIRITLTQNKQPFSLDNIARIDLHAQYQGQTVLMLSTENALIQIADKALGQILLSFPHRLTEMENWIEANFDLQLTFQDGTVKTVLGGSIQLVKDITKVSKNE